MAVGVRGGGEGGKVEGGWVGGVKQSQALLCGVGLVPHRVMQGALLQAVSAKPTTSGLPKLTLEKV